MIENEIIGMYDSAIDSILYDIGQSMNVHITSDQPLHNAAIHTVHFLAFTARMIGKRGLCTSDKAKDFLIRQYTINRN